MSSFLGPVQGFWSISSMLDPRWNAEGVVYEHVFSRAPASERRIEELIALYGDPPNDLVYWDSTGRLELEKD